MTSRAAALIAFFHLSLLHWTAAKRRIFLSLAFTAIIVGLAFSMFAIRGSYINNLLEFYEQRNPLHSNGSPTVRFSTTTSMAGSDPWQGFPVDISDYVDNFLKEAGLEPVAAKTLLIFSFQFEMIVPGLQRTSTVNVGGVPDEIFSMLDMALTEGRIPTNHSEVIDLNLFKRYKVNFDPNFDNMSLKAVSREAGFFENQTLAVVGQSDDESLIASLEALFPRDLLLQSRNWDLLTSIDNLLELAGGFTNFDSLTYGYLEVRWDISKIDVDNLGMWKSRARNFEARLEGSKNLLGSPMRFVTNKELSQLLADFKEERQQFDLSYLLLSLPLFLLVVLALLEVNRVGHESRSREFELLHLHGVGLLEATSILVIERLLIACGSLIMGIILSPFFVWLTQVTLLGSSSLDVKNAPIEALSIDIWALLAAMIILTSIPNIVGPLRRNKRLQTSVKQRKNIGSQTYLILAAIICIGIVLMLFASVALDIAGSGETGSTDLAYFGDNLDFAASSIFMLVVPFLIIYVSIIFIGKIGSLVWRSYARKLTLPLLLFREDARFMARPAFILFLAIMLLIPSLVVGPSIDAHLEEESQLVVGSTLIVDNWEDTIPAAGVHNLSSAIEETSLVHHILLNGMFPPLREKLSILIIDPINFGKMASLEKGSGGLLVPPNSIRQLSTSETVLMGSDGAADLERGDWISFKSWDVIEEENLTHYVPKELEFQITGFFDLFPLLSITTQVLTGYEETDEIDELVMSHLSWNALSNHLSQDSLVQWSIKTSLLVRLSDVSMQQQVARKIQETFGRPVKTVDSVKQSFENPFHESYTIIAATSLLFSLIAALTIGAASANTLMNRQRGGFEVLLLRGMSRRRVTFIAAQEFALLIIMPSILGILFGYMYLSSMRGILSIYENLLSFQWLLNPFEINFAVLALILGVFLLWIGSFFIAISRSHFAFGD